MDADQIRAARALIRWSQADLSEKSKVSVPTIKRLEGMEGEVTGHATTIAALQAALEDGGVIFLDDGGHREGGPGVRLAKAQAGGRSDD